MTKKPKQVKVKAWLNLQNRELGFKDAYGATVYYIASTRRAVKKFGVYIDGKTKQIPITITYEPPKTRKPRS